MAANERIEQFERLLEVARGLTTAPDIEAFLQTIITEASEMTNSEFASVLEYEEVGKELRFLSMAWIHREALRPVGVPLDGSAAGWVFRKGQALIIQDTKIDQRHFKAPDRISQYETRSLAAVPLITHGRTAKLSACWRRSTKRTTRITPMRTWRSSPRLGRLPRKRCGTIACGVK